MIIEERFVNRYSKWFCPKCKCTVWVMDLFDPKLGLVVLVCSKCYSEL